MASKLLELAREHFGRLARAEEKLFRAVEKGELADYRSKKKDENDPGGADTWGKERVLEADRIRWLCTDRLASALVSHKGLLVLGARIDEKLDLRSARVPFALTFAHCAFSDPMGLQNTRIPELYLNGTHTKAITADGIRVDGDLFMRDGFKAQGEVRLVGARIGGNLECDKSTFKNPEGMALAADGINVKGCVFLRNGFKAEGEVSFVSAFIERDFVWAGVHPDTDATLDLRSAQIRTFRDDEKSWPKQDKLLLNGLVYDEFGDDAPTDADARIRWLRRQPTVPFRPQPYEQLAEVLKKMGHEEDAKKVLIAKNDDRLKHANLGRWPRLRRSGGWLFRKFLGYGYRPWRPLWIGLVIIGIGWGLFAMGFAGNVMTPTQQQPVLWGPWYETIPLPGAHPSGPLIYRVIHPLAYSVDAFIPLTDLRQVCESLPDAGLSGRWWFLPVSGWWLRVYLWFEILAGWVLTTLLVLGLSGLIRR